MICKTAYERGLSLKTKLFITPGSRQVEETMKRDGFTKIFEKLGGIILSNACGPCIGQWDRTDIGEGEKNVIVTSFNRNFKKRNDGRTETYAFVASPEMVVALAFAGRLSFNPLVDTLLNNEEGEEIALTVPSVPDVPPEGFAPVSLIGCVLPPEGGTDIEVVIDPQSDRLALLEPFAKWSLSEDFAHLVVLAKSRGKTTTDHISPAGPWLKYRGHLDRISNNLFVGVQNDFYPNEVGKGRDRETGSVDELNKIAREYQKKDIGWVFVGDENYGEGSSREHAAMEPRYLGCRAVIVRSIARIAETNLKKQGVLPLVFIHKDDYEIIQERDTITLLNLENLGSGKEVILEVKHEDGSRDYVHTIHSLNEEQIQWFYAGSALNFIGEKLKNTHVEG